MLVLALHAWRLRLPQLPLLQVGVRYPGLLATDKCVHLSPTDATTDEVAAAKTLGNNA